MANKKVAAVKTKSAVEQKPARRRVRIGEDGRNILNVEAPKGYVGRWVNDDDSNRVQDLIDRGYQIYTGNDKSSDDGLVGASDGVGAAMVKNVGRGMQGVYMIQRKEYYDEDQADKAKIVDDKESSLRANTNEGQYGSITIKK